MPTYDVIVLGCGGVGSAALYHLAKRGVQVLGLDQFPPGHNRGSSHGRTRIIRQAYFEHPDYVPLLLRAYELWQELSDHYGKQLYHEIGLLQIGPPDGHVVPGVLQAARSHGLAVDHLTAQQPQRCFSAFHVPSGWEAVFEQRAGYLDVEDCVLAHLVEAQKLEAELRTGVIVQSWQANGDSVTVETNQGTFQAAKLVISAGSWADSFLNHLDFGLKIRRKEVFWFPIGDDSFRADRGCPAYLFETSDGIFYGIPLVDKWGLKVARHNGGQLVTDPLAIDREVDHNERQDIQRFLSHHLPGIDRPFIDHSVCLYTMSPDENFIVDVHPQYPQVSFATGLSGHGFKFTCVLGEILADLALEGHTRHPIGFLNCRRFRTV
ncbi:MAG TPA: N-methyl-L-tryptophan oxidase [Pirellulales bacterium]